MANLAFSAVVALGINRLHGAVLSVHAVDGEVRRIVMRDIMAHGDRQFIDLLGPLMPRTGLLQIHAELDGNHDIKHDPVYKLKRFATLTIPSDESCNTS